MGDLKIGDKIIVTDVLTSCSDKRIQVMGKVFEVKYVDTILNTFKFQITYNNIQFWVEGIPYSPLMAELV